MRAFFSKSSYSSSSLITRLHLRTVFLISLLYFPDLGQYFRYPESIEKWNSSSIAFKLQNLQSLPSFLILCNFSVTTANVFDENLSLDTTCLILKLFKFKYF